MASTKSFSISLESDLPIVQQNGLNTNKATFLGGAVEVAGTLTLDSSVSASGSIAVQSGNAISSTAAQAVALSSTNTFGIYYGSGVPAAAAATGSIYLRSDGSNASNRAYVSSGGTAWTAIVTIA